MIKIDVQRLFDEFSHIVQVEAIALGGSRATGRNDEKSDYDVYIYLTDSVDENVRRNILEKYCKYMEISNTFWELEDDVTLKDGIDMDIIYRDMKDFEKMISSVVDDCVAWNGYTTCMWHNLITSKIVYDRNGNPYWTCSCYIRSHSIEETAYETSKKLAKKYSAYKCICNICGLQDEYAEED